MVRHSSWHVLVKVAALLSSPFLVAAAYRDTVPIIAWSSHSSHNLDALSTYTDSYSGSADLLHRFLQLDDDELCNFDTIILVDQPGLSAADLKTSPFITKQLSNAPSSLQIPYLPCSNSESTEFETFKESLAEKCKSERQEISLGSRPRSETKQIMGISMPALDASDGGSRRQIFTQTQRQLENVIEDQASSSNSYLIIYTSSVSARVENGFDKAESLVHSQPIHAEVAEPVFNSTLPTGSLLERYRFFTPGILIGFLIGFVVLLPILLFGIYALASIQTPSRTDTVGSTRTVSLNKKNQ